MKIAGRCRLMTILLCILCCFTGCGRSGDAEPVSPFSGLSWNSSREEMRASEGEPADSYVSVYNGTTYVYNREYQERNGTLKYMFDADGNLMCIAWAYEAEDADDLDTVYHDLHAEVEAVCGGSGYNPSGSTNYGDVWYRTDGDIIISAVTAGGKYALQYAYLNPLVSNRDAVR